MIDKRTDIDIKEQTQTIKNQKPCFDLGRKLLVEGIAFATISSLPFVTGCGTTNYNSNWNYGTKHEENDKITSAEKRVLYNGRYYTYRIESRGDYIYEYLDDILSEKSSVFEYIDKRDFGGDFSTERFIVFDHSIVWIGIDGNGNYGFVIQEGIVGKVNYHSIRCILPVEDLKRRRINLKIDYNKEDGEYIIEEERDNKTVVISKINYHGKVTYNNSKDIDELFPEE